MFSLCRRKVRSQAPCSFPVRSGSRNKATASVCGRKLFTQDSFRFSGSHSIDYKWPKNCAKKNMGAFYSLKNNPVFIIVQSCCSVFPKEPALGSADQQITLLPSSLLNKSPTCTTFSLLEWYQIFKPHYVFRSGIYKRWVLSFCIRNTWNIPTKEQLCDKPAQQHFICSWELANKALLSDTVAKTILFSKEKDAGEVVFIPPMFSTNFIISK